MKYMYGFPKPPTEKKHSTYNPPKYFKNAEYCHIGKSCTYTLTLLSKSKKLITNSVKIGCIKLL